MADSNERKVKIGGGKMNQFSMAIILNLPVLAYAITIGWWSPIGPLLQSTESPLGAPASDEAASWLASIICATAVPGVFLYGYVAENWGRKVASLATSISFLICFAIKIFARNEWILVAARAVAGLGAGGCFVVTPMYVKEIAEDSVRGTLASFLILEQNIGYLLIYLAGDLLEYGTILWIGLAVPFIHVVLQSLMPESPSYLVKRGRPDEALKVVAWLRQTDVLDKQVVMEVDLLKSEEHESQKAEKMSIRTILQDNNTFKAFRLGLVVVSSQIANGCFVVAVYAGTIFKMASAGNAGEGFLSSMSPNRQAIFIAILQMVGSFVASSLIEKIGRKPLLVATNVVVTIGMAVLGTWFYLLQIGVEAPSWLPIVTVSLCIFSNSAGCMPVPYVILSEIFTFKIRGTVSVYIVSFGWLLGFILAKLFGPLVAAIGIHCVFWMFSLFCVGFLTFIIFCVPETRGKSVEEIYAELEGKGRKNNTTDNIKV